MSLEIAPGHIDEIKALIETGDVSLAETRQKFLLSQGRKTTCDDEKLIRAIAATDDDDDKLLVQNILIAEKE